MTRIGLLTTFCALSAFSQKIPAPTPADSYTVLYTGRMLGNFRDPELQCRPAADPHCPVLPPKAAMALNSRMNDAKDAAMGTTVRVASGDNFAPYLLAREVWDAQNGRLQWKQDAPRRSDPGFQAYVGGRGKILEDNVVSLLLKMNFDALVPGKHDFYFGPERLRELARLMEESSHGHTRMLASNLVLHTQRTDKNQQDGVALEAQPPAPSGNASHGLMDPVVGLPKIVLPWMRSVRIRNAFYVALAADGKRSLSSLMSLQSSNFEERAKENFREWLGAFPKGTPKPLQTTSLSAQNYTFTPKISRACIVEVDPKQAPLSENPPCVAKFVMQPAQDTEPKADAEYELRKDAELLNPNGHYALCLTMKDNTWSCSPFTVQQTFLEYPADEKKLTKRFKPWVLKSREPGQVPVAIFGVVDPDLMQSVGRLNYTWLGVTQTGDHHDDRYETVVQAAQPGESLKQVLRYCLQDDECRAAHKILLAQMPEEDAYGIVGQLQALKGLPSTEAGFEVIVAAADRNRASGDRIIIRKRSASQPEFRQPVVLVPGEHGAGTDPYRLRVRVQEAIVTPSIGAGDRDFAGDRIIRNQVFAGDANDTVDVNPVVLPQSDKRETLLNRLRAHPPLVRDTGLGPKPTDEEATRALELIALKVMRQTCHSDAAVLQHRDVFFSGSTGFFTQPVDDAWARALIDAIFWKGDFIQCTQITGDTIKALLQRSKELQDQENIGISTDFSLGWGLATIGLDKNEPDPLKRKINGAYIDPKKLYSVAITDYVANGDTGYPMLQNAQPLPADKWSEVSLLSLADAIQDQLLPPLPETISRRAPDLLDEAIHQQPPAKHQPGMSDWAKSLFHDQSSGKKDVKDSTQQHFVWSIDLYKADASLALFLHKGTEPQLGERFPGVTSVDLSSPNTETIAFDYSLRVEGSGSHASFYIESDLNYGHKANRTPQNVYQRSETADYYYHEIGLAPNLWPRHRNPSTLKLLLPVAIRTQLWSPITQITPGADTTGAKAIASQAPINYTFGVRPGLRWDHAYPKPDILTAAAPPTPTKGQPGQPQLQTGQLWTSYIEAGYEIGRLHNGPSAFIFNGVPSPKAPAGTLPVNQECQVYDTGCIMSTPADTASYSTYTANVVAGRKHTQAGFYLDFRFDVPLPKFTAIEFVTENRGDFFAFGRPGDSPVDTRFFNDLKTSITFPIPGLRKVNLAPTFEWVSFKNRRTNYAGLLIPGNTYFSLNSYVSLNYSFDWHQGLEWKKVLGFNNPTPPLSSLPTR